MKDAASGLRASEPTGMPTKGAAYALLAEAALHGAAYIESGQSEYYEIARQASEDLFALNVYSLDTDYKNMFNDFDHSQNSKEIILAQWKSSDNTIFQNTWMQDLVPNNDNNKNKEGSLPLLVEELAGWPKSFPSVDLVNQYLVVDEDGKAKEWDETSYYQNFLAKGGYVSNAIYKNRDNRFYASIAQDSSNYFKNTITMRKKGNLNWASKAAEIWGTPISGYVYRKGVYEAVRLLNSEPTSYHYVLLRLGRSYLNYAEVMLRQNKVNAAIEYINKTRTVHGGLPELPSGLSAEEAWKEYKRERRIELLHENDRYWSLLRWGKADGLEIVKELNTHQNACMEIAEDGKSFEIIDLPSNISDNNHAFTSRRYLFPVPQSERDVNSSLDQNPEW